MFLWENIARSFIYEKLQLKGLYWKWKLAQITTLRAQFYLGVLLIPFWRCNYIF